MSRFFSQEAHFNNPLSQPGSNIVIPLVKFSCSSTHKSSIAPSHWTHYSRKDLELVIQNVQVGHSQFQNESRRHSVMKVVAGAEYLEEQDLDVIARMSKDFVPSPGIEIPVKVMVKSPLLALRYPKVHDIRRVQFRFRDDSGDLNQFVDILRSLGLVAENVPQKPFSQFRPPSVNSTSSEISVAPSTPTTSYLSSSQHTEFKVPLRPDSANSSTSRFDNHISTRPLSSMSISTFMLQSKPSVEPLNRAQSFLIHQMEREPLEKQSSNFVAASPNSILSTDDTYKERVLIRKSDESQLHFPPSPVLNLQARGHQPNISNSFSTANDTTNYNPNSYGTAMGRFGSPAEHIVLSCQKEYPTLNTFGKRPMVSTVGYDPFFDLPIPPKRQLPFSTVTKPSNIETSIFRSADSSVKTTSERSRPPQITFHTSPPNEIFKPIKKPTKGRIADRKITTCLPSTIGSSCVSLSSTKRTTDNDLEVPTQIESPPYPTSKRVSASAASKTPSMMKPMGFTDDEQPVLALHKRSLTPIMVNSSTQTQTLSGRDHTTAFKSTQSASATKPPSNLPSSPPVFAPSNIVSNYRDIPHDVRHEMLHAFLIESSKNEKLSQLAKDMVAARLGPSEHVRHKADREFMDRKMKNEDYCQLIDDMDSTLSGQHFKKRTEALFRSDVGRQT